MANNTKISQPDCSGDNTGDHPYFSQDVPGVSSVGSICPLVEGLASRPELTESVDSTAIGEDVARNTTPIQQRDSAGGVYITGSSSDVRFRPAVISSSCLYSNRFRRGYQMQNSECIAGCCIAQPARGMGSAFRTTDGSAEESGN